MHDGLQRVPPARRDVPFKARQQRDHHVHPESLVLPETQQSSGNISLEVSQQPGKVTASHKVKSPQSQFPRDAQLGSPSKAPTQILREQSVECISIFRKSSPAIRTSVSAPSGGEGIIYSQQTKEAKGKKPRFLLKFRGRLRIFQIVSATIKVCLSTPVAQSH